MKQATFTDIEYSFRKKKTRREEFLEIMDEIIPWDEWAGVIEPYYPKGKRGRPPMGIEKMLRMYLLQIWFNLSDPATEDAIYDSYAMRKFTGIDFMKESVPDETTLCKFRHLLEEHGLNKLFFDAINRAMVQTGHMMKGGKTDHFRVVRVYPDCQAVLFRLFFKIQDFIGLEDVSDALRFSGFRSGGNKQKRVRKRFPEYRQDMFYFFRRCRFRSDFDSQNPAVRSEYLPECPDLRLPDLHALRSEGQKRIPSDRRCAGKNPPDFFVGVMSFRVRPDGMAADESCIRIQQRPDNRPQFPGLNAHWSSLLLNK